MEALRKALQAGYLLHGSPHFIQGCLGPRLAKLLTETTEQEEDQPLLYATSHIEVAIATAVFHPGERKSRAWSVDFPETGRVRVFGGENIDLKNGYVYILPAEFFKGSQGHPGMHTGSVPVTPIQRVVVTPQDLLDIQSEFGFTINIR